MTNRHILLCALALMAVLHAPSWAQTIPYPPGRYSWKVADGEIQLVAARYTNRHSFDNRAYTFYFEAADRQQTYIVPVVGAKPGNTVLTTTSSAGGDWLFADVAVRQQGGTLQLIKVRQDTAGGWSSPGDLTIETYRLSKGDEDDMPYQFVLQHKAVTPGAARISVDKVLHQQLGRSPR